MTECKRCCILHPNRDEAVAIHRATDSVHKWFRGRLRAILAEPKPEPKRRKRAWGDGGKSALEEYAR